MLVPWENVLFYRHTKAAAYIRSCLHRYSAFPFVQRILYVADMLIGAALTVAMKQASSALDAIIPIPPSVPTPGNRRAREAVARLDETVYRLIRERRRDGLDRGDFLSMLLLAQDEDDGSTMTDVQVRDEAMGPSPTGPGQHLAWPCRGCGTPLDPGRHPQCPACGHLVVAQGLPDLLPLLQAAEARLAPAAAARAEPQRPQASATHDAWRRCAMRVATVHARAHVRSGARTLAR